ncbi:MAG: ribonuclease P protein component [Woeseiaceae bacterium]
MSGDSPDQRFTSSRRLTDGESFDRVFKKARPSRDNMFTVLTTENKSSDARLGLAIAKKHCKLAVSRNRIKRIVRESFRRHREQLAGLDIVVMNRPATHEAGNQALHDSLAKHWQKCGASRPISQDR